MRADLAGGTLDIWPLYLALENCKTVQFSIPFYTQLQLNSFQESSSISVHFQNELFSAKNLDEFLLLSDSKLRLIQVILNYVRPPKGLELKIFSDSPLGGGIGASSCFCVCLLRCLEQAFQLEYPNILYLCRDLEAQALKTSTGIQDYIIPLQTVSQVQFANDQRQWPPQNVQINPLTSLPLPFESKKKMIFSDSFINIIHLGAGGLKVETLDLPQEIIDQHLLFVDSGISHQSEVSNSAMVQKAMENPKSFQECRDIALEMAWACQNKKFDQWPDLFEREYQFRKTLHGYIHKDVESIKDYLIQRGSTQAVKVMGAGGGGLLLVWTSDKNQTKKACENKQLRFFDSHWNRNGIKNTYADV